MSNSVIPLSSSVSKSHSGMRIAHLNICSLFNKCSFIYSYLLTHDIDIFSLNETWLNSSISNTSLFLPGYRIFRVDRTYACGWGVCILVRNKFNAQTVNTIMSVNIELLHVCLLFKNCRSLNIVSVYRPPKCSYLSFVNEFCSFFSHVNFFNNFILLGDVNINILDTKSPATSLFLSRARGLDLWLVDKNSPTRVTESHESLIDVCFTNSPHWTSNFLNIPVAFSDHNLVSFCFKRPKTCPSPITHFYTPNYHRLPPCFADALLNINFPECLDSNFLDDSVQALFCSLNSLFDTIPKRKVINRPASHPWITANFLNLCKKRDVLLLSARNSPMFSVVSEYRRLRNMCLSMSRKLKHDYFQKTLSKACAKSDPRLYWRTLNALMPTRSADKPTSVRVEGELLSNSSVIAEHVNNFFVNTVPDIHFNHFYFPFQCVCRGVNDHLADFNFQPCELRDVYKLVCAVVKTDRSSYSISPSLLKLYPHTFASIFHVIFNQCIHHRVFPLIFKHSTVIPIPKSPGLSTLANFRPISLLPNIGKVFEKVLATQIKLYLEENNLLYFRQYGFRNGHSTSSCCLDLLNSVCSNIDSRLHVAAVFIDFSKAFDIIDHSILVHKLRHIFNFSDGACELVLSYLSERTQSVCFNSVSSSTKPVSFGVPQGSILGPLFFIMFVNDMHCFVKNSVLFQYADDSTLVVASHSLDRLQLLLNDDLASISYFCVSNKLLLNTDKTKYILFRCPTPELSLHIGDNAIAGVMVQKFLGLKIDHNLRFNEQISHVVSKLSSASFVLAKHHSILPVHALKLIFNCLATPHLDYCLCAYFNFLNVAQIDTVTSKYVRCARFVLADFVSNSNCILNTLSLPSYTQRAHSLQLVFIRKLVLFKSPRALYETFQRPNHEYYTRFTSKSFSIRRARVRIGECSFAWWGARLYNNNLIPVSF